MTGPGLSGYVLGPSTGYPWQATVGVFEVLDEHLAVVESGLLRARDLTGVQLPSPGRYLVHGVLPFGERISGILEHAGGPDDMPVIELGDAAQPRHRPTVHSGWIAAWRPVAGTAFEPVAATGLRDTRKGLVVETAAGGGENVVLQWAVGAEAPRCTAVPAGTPVQFMDGPRLDPGSDLGFLLLNFLDQGDVTRAAVVAGSLPRSVPDDATLAVAVGYFLLGTGDDRLTAWAEELVDRWPRMFDAHLLRGWARLYASSEWQLAGAALHDASRLGLPMAARGLRLFDDAVRLVSSVPGQPPETLRESLLPHLRSVQDAALTTFWGRRPDLPSPTPVPAAAPSHARDFDVSEGRIRLAPAESGGPSPTGVVPTSIRIESVDLPNDADVPAPVQAGDSTGHGGIRRRVLLPAQVAGRSGVLRKGLLTVVFAGLTFLITHALHLSPSTQVILSILVGGIALILRFLIDFENRLAAVEQLEKDGTTEMRHLVGDAFSEIREATDLFRLIEASALETDLLTRLVRNSTQISPASPPIIYHFVQAKIRETSDFLKQLSEGGTVTYYGEDREWLLGLTRNATSGIDAISMTAVDHDLWQSEIGQRYLDAQWRAAGRGTQVRRIFVFDSPAMADDPALLRTCEEQLRMGINVRLLDRAAVPPPLRVQVRDLIVFDDTLAYETNPTVTADPRQAQIAETRLILTDSRVKECAQLFRELWEISRESDWRDGTAVSG